MIIKMKLFFNCMENIYKEIKNKIRWLRLNMNKFLNFELFVYKYI